MSKEMRVVGRKQSCPKASVSQEPNSRHSRCSLSRTDILAGGARALAEALKINTTLTALM